MASIFNQDIGLNYKGIITLGSTINQNLSGTLQYLTDGDGNNLPLQLATGLVAVDGGTIAFTTGTNVRNVLTQTYTVNNTGGTNTVRGIFLNATETAVVGTTHSLLDLQVGNVSRLRVINSGNVVIGDASAPSASRLNVAGDIFLRVNDNIGGGQIYGTLWNKIMPYNSSNGEMAITMYNTSWFLRHNANMSVAGNTVIGTTTPSARLHVRGDGANPIGRFEHSDGTAALLVQHSPNGIGLQTSGSWLAYNNSTTQLVGIQGNIFYVFNSTTRFQIDLTSNQVTLSGRLLGSASTTARASMNIPSGVAPTSPVDGDIWFDGTNIFMRIGGVTKTFTLTP